MPGVRIDFEGHFAQFNDSLDQVKRKVTKTSDDITRAFTSIRAGVVGSAVALTGLSGGAIFAGMIRGANEAEQASLRLSNALKVTGSAAGVTKEEIDDLADAMAKSTQFDDESIRNAASELLVFRNVQGDVFRDTLKLSADVAAALGTNIPEAAAKLGRSLEDPDTAFGLLRRQGIVLSEQQKDLIKRLGEVGDKAGQQRIVLEQLQKAFGGLAETLNTGVNKATHDVRKAWDELLEALGKSPAVQSSATTFLDTVAGGLNKIRDIFESGAWWDRLQAFGRFGFGPGIAALVAGGRERQPGIGTDREDAELGAAMGSARQRQSQIDEANYIKDRERIKKLKEEREAAAKAAAAEAAAVAKLFDKLQRDTSAKALGLNFATPKTREEFEKIKDVLEGARKSMLDMADAVFEQAEAQDRALASGPSWTEQMEKARESTLGAIDPLHEYKKQLEEMKKALDTGWISQQQFNDAVAKNPLRQGVIDQIDPVANIRRQMDAVRELEKLGKDQGGLTSTEATEALFKLENDMEDVLDRIGKRLQENNDVAKDFTHAISTAFEQAVIGGKKASDVLRSFAQTLLQITTRVLVTKPLESALTSALSSSGVGNLFSNLFSGITGRASGGSVSAGSPFLVGEKGPELFVPRSDGTIVPNGQLSAAGGPQINVDMRNSLVSVDAVRLLNQKIDQLQSAVPNMAVSAVASAAFRGGAVQSVLRGA